MRLRPSPTSAQMAALYPRPHDHTIFPDHLIRVDETIKMAAAMLPHRGTVADLSCGDGAIARSLAETHGASLILGDFAPGYPIRGLIEMTAFEAIPSGAPSVDLWILSETLEHLDDPELVLRLIRERAKALVLSTPVGADGDTNPEHLWSWSADDVAEMLEAAGWTGQLHKVLEHPAGGIYSFGLWGCS